MASRVIFPFVEGMDISKPLRCPSPLFLLDGVELLQLGAMLYLNFAHHLLNDTHKGIELELRTKHYNAQYISL